MAKTTVAAKEYIAHIIGGGAESQESLDMASEALLRGYADWQAKKFWRFLLKDTSATTAVSAVTATASSAVVNAPSAGAFDFTNVGQTVTISAGTATLVAGTTISLVTRGADGVVTSITLSNAFGGTTNSNATLTFSANIPITAGTNDYSLPNDFNAPYIARLTVAPRILTYRDQRYWDRVIVNLTVRGTPSEYTTYNPVSELSQNFGSYRMKFDRIPDVADELFVRYYRKFNTTGTYIDMPDDILYVFLDYCRNILLATKKAQEDPQAYAQNVLSASEQADKSDEENTDDNDTDQYLKSAWEMGDFNRPVWGNGGFDAFRY